MKYTVNNEEKELLKSFRQLRIPTIFKTDNTDRILFVENIDFTVCDFLLKGKTFSSALFNEIIDGYERFVKDTDVNEFDEYALNYYTLCLQVIEIFKKYQRSYE